MRTNVHPIVLTLILGVGLGVASCDKSPTRPTPQSGTVVTPTAAVTRIEIVGPTSVEPGGSAQFTANAVKSDGSVENVTSQAQWTSTNTAVLRVDSAGLVSAAARGEATINVRHASRAATAQVMVLPPGTFRLTGQVSDSGLPLDGVTLTVIEGTGEGLTGVTNGAGAYALYGVAGRVKLHAKKDGFRNSIEEVEVRENRALDFEMRFDGEELDDLSGTYALELRSGNCVTLPENARKRSYVAHVEQRGARLSVRLSGADFILYNGRGDHFEGTTARDGSVTFTIGDFYYYYWYYAPSAFDLIERLDATSALLVAGAVSARTSASGISGSLSGMIGTTPDVNGPFRNISSSCVSSEHRFDMRRQ